MRMIVCFTMKCVSCKTIHHRVIVSSAVIIIVRVTIPVTEIFRIYFLVEKKNEHSEWLWFGVIVLDSTKM